MVGIIDYIDKHASMNAVSARTWQEALCTADSKRWSRIHRLAETIEDARAAAKEQDWDFNVKPINANTILVSPYNGNKQAASSQG